MGKEVSKKLQDGATGTGNGTVFDVEGAEAIHVEVWHSAGSFVATITFETSLDQSNWNPIGLTQKSDNSTVATTATAGGAFFGDIRGVKFFRARISAYTSGTLQVMAGIYTVQ